MLQYVYIGTTLALAILGFFFNFFKVDPLDKTKRKISNWGILILLLTVASSVFAFSEAYNNNKKIEEEQRKRSYINLSEKTELRKQVKELLYPFYLIGRVRPSKNSLINFTSKSNKEILDTLSGKEYLNRISHLNIFSSSIDSINYDVLFMNAIENTMNYFEKIFNYKTDYLSDEVVGKIYALQKHKGLNNFLIQLKDERSARNGITFYSAILGEESYEDLMINLKQLDSQLDVGR